MPRRLRRSWRHQRQIGRNRFLGHGLREHLLPWNLYKGGQVRQVDSRIRQQDQQTQRLRKPRVNSWSENFLERAFLRIFLRQD